MLDKLDTAYVEVVLCIRIQYCLTVNAAGCNAWMSIQLGTAPDEGHKLIVVQAPNPVGACWFQPAACNQGLQTQHMQVDLLSLKTSLWLHTKNQCSHATHSLGM